MTKTCLLSLKSHSVFEEADTQGYGVNPEEGHTVSQRVGGLSRLQALLCSPFSASFILAKARPLLFVVCFSPHLTVFQTGLGPSFLFPLCVKSPSF